MKVDSLLDADCTPVFVLGPPRSGTSVFRDLLCMCESVYLPPEETQLLPGLIRLFDSARIRKVNKAKVADFVLDSSFLLLMKKQGLSFSNMEIQGVIDSSSASNTFKNLILLVAKKSGETSLKVWGDKTPTYYQYIDYIYDCFPKAKIVFITRDPRNTVLSMKESWNKSIPGGCEIWNNAMGKLLDGLEKYPSNILMVVRYEKFTSDPCATMKEVESFLGVKFLQSRLSCYKSDERWGSKKNLIGVVKSDDGRYAKQFSQSEIKKIETLCFSEMTALGYDVNFAAGPASVKYHERIVSKLTDKFGSLAAYIKERGLFEALRYKFRQWKTWSIAGSI